MIPYRTTFLRLRRLLWLRLPRYALLLAAALVMAPRARAGDGVVVVKTRPYVSHFHAYGEVVPINVLRLRAAATGVVSGLDALPGEKVRAGATLAHLSGPAISAALAHRQAALAGAESALAAAEESLRVQRQNQRGHLATRQAVAQAEAAVGEARARTDDANAQLATLRGNMAVRAPKAGQVLSVEAANGERVSPGQALLTLQSADDLWLRAAFYGLAAANVHAGMTGRFQSANGGGPIPVMVRGLLGVVRTGGGMEVGCVPAAPGAAPWQNGEAGSLVLDGETGTLPAVPTRALVLDRGQWWVMLRTPQGDRRQAVEPGPVRGDDTLIRHGLSPGAQVVVENAYLDFHRDFAQHYQQPD